MKAQVRVVYTITDTTGNPAKGFKNYDIDVQDPELIAEYIKDIVNKHHTSDNQQFKNAQVIGNFNPDDLSDVTAVPYISWNTDS